MASNAETFLDAVHEFLHNAVLSKVEVDRFLDPKAPKWARFDAELGYVPNDSQVPDGIDGAITTYRYGPRGERQMINYAGDESRIASYGDSFTQCHQVSDGETWQEVLAAHVGEPIQNFGVGGYGVYQAYLRLRRTELDAAGGAPYVLFNIFDDDHYRNLDAYRLLRVGRVWRDYDQSLTTSMFHANPWAHVRFDPLTAELVHVANEFSTPESLYQLCDYDFLVNRFEKDFVVNLLVARRTGDFQFLLEYEQLASALDVLVSYETPMEAGRCAERLYSAMAFRSSLLILQQLRDELSARDKKLLVLLSYSEPAVRRVLTDGTRDDEWVLRQLEARGFTFVDALACHGGDYAAFSISPDQYVGRLFNGHYTPAGNLFFAFAIKDAVVGWLSPPPPAYRDRETSFAMQAAKLA
jgi:hypothetical protein